MQPGADSSVAHEQPALACDPQQHAVLAARANRLALGHRVEIGDGEAELLREQALRIINLFASEAAGRTYLLRQPELVPKLCALLRLETTDSIARQNALGALQSLLHDSYGAEYFNANRQSPILFLSVLLYSQQFERALAFLAREADFAEEAVHMGIALAHEGLLHVADTPVAGPKLRPHGGPLPPPQRPGLPPPPPLRRRRPRRPQETARLWCATRLLAVCSPAGTCPRAGRASTAQT